MVALCGYSFGAAVAAAIAGESSARALVLVSPPVGVTPLAPIPDGLDVLLVTADLDAVSPAEAVRALAAPGRQVEVVTGAAHAWWPGVEELRDIVGRFAANLNA